MRIFKGKLAFGFSIWALIILVFHLYTSYFGTYSPKVQRSLHLFFLLPLAFLVFPSRRRNTNKNNPTILDWILASISLIPSFYLFMNADSLNMRIEQVDEVTSTQIILGTLMVGLVLEACRRAVSFVFAIVVAVFFGYIFIAPFLPGMFNARQMSFDRVIEVVYLTSDQGIYGFLTGISSNILFVFIAFAAIMLRSGVGKYFMDVAIFLTGRFRGGPAKIAVLSSGLYGSISGSSVSDVYSTGSFSIPLMKKIGYPSTKAGAIEAVASAGGPLIPPVMGAGAFIMAEMTSTSYTTIIKAAILGAIIYYIGILATVHFEAVALNLPKLPDEWKVKYQVILKKSPYLIPFGAMVYSLFTGLSPAKSAVISIGVSIIIWFIMSKGKINVKDFIEGVNYAARGATVIAAALAGAGIIVAVLTQTGAALAMSNIILTFSFGNLWLALILIMFVTLILGAGIPTTPAYVITATVATGALASFHIPVLTSHLFVFYFAILADITPPVGVTAFAAANISESPPMKTALMTPKFAFAGFLVPFLFIFSPELILSEQSSLFEILFTFIVTSIAVVLFAAVIVGYLFQKLSFFKRLLLLTGVFVSISNIFLISIVGILLLFGLLLYEFYIYKTKQGKPINSFKEEIAKENY